VRVSDTGTGMDKDVLATEASLLARVRQAIDGREG
jgi:hypothetical protein